MRERNRKHAAAFCICLLVLVMLGIAGGALAAMKVRAPKTWRISTAEMAGTEINPDAISDISYVAGTVYSSYIGQRPEAFMRDFGLSISVQELRNSDGTYTEIQDYGFAEVYISGGNSDGRWITDIVLTETETNR